MHSVNKQHAIHSVCTKLGRFYQKENFLCVRRLAGLQQPIGFPVGSYRKSFRTDSENQKSRLVSTCVGNKSQPRVVN